MWDTDTGECLGIFKGHSADLVTIQCRVINGKPWLFSGGEDFLAYKWDIESKEIDTIYLGNSNKVYDIYVTLDGK